MRDWGHIAARPNWDARTNSGDPRPAAAWCRCPDKDLPGSAAGGRHLEKAGQCADNHTDLEARQLPAMRRRASRETDTRLLCRLLHGTLRASPIRGTKTAPTSCVVNRMIAGRQSIGGRRATRFCICCTPRLLHPRNKATGHIAFDEPLQANTPSGWGMVVPTRPTGRPTATYAQHAEGPGSRRRHGLSAPAADKRRRSRHRSDREESKSKRNTSIPTNIITTDGRRRPRWSAVGLAARPAT